MKHKEINIPNIGNIYIEKSKRAKHLSISISNCARIRVAVPMFITFNQAEKFTYSKVSWLRKNLSKMKTNKIKLDKPNKEIARKILTKRLNDLCDKYNFSYNRLFIRNQKTRWGSCSGQNNINLNAKLILLPNELIDYVLLHELVHTRIKNHSKEFWDSLDNLILDSKKKHKELNNYVL